MQSTPLRTDLAGQLKAYLTMDEVVRRYGFEPNRSGFLRCPFHQGDHSASLKVYPGAKGWHCFGCQKGGSVIDFVMQLFNIDFRDACLRLNEDFRLGLADEKPDPAERSAALEARRQEQKRRRGSEAEHRILAAEHCYWWQVKTLFMPGNKEISVHPLYVDAVKRLPWLEYRLDELDTELARR